MTRAALKMTKARAEELLVPLYKDTAKGISLDWQARMVEALEYVIKHDTAEQSAQADGACTCDLPWFLEYEDGEHCKVCGKPPRR